MTESTRAATAAPQDEREAFEAWVKSPPYEHDTRRFPNDETLYSWPGQYRDIAVELAWSAWQASAASPVAAPTPYEWRGLTKDEIDHEVGELVELGTDFVAPLYAAVEGIERKLRERNAAAASPAQEGWQPIETAPKVKDAPLLLTNGVSVAQGWWMDEPGYIREKRDLDGRYIDQDESDGYTGWMDCDGGMLPEPTHWRPLPAPPAALGASAAKGEQP